MLNNDYENNVIKKHEYTREDKEKDRTTHLNIVDANTGPVFMLFKNDEQKNIIFQKIIDSDVEVDFTENDGVRHIIRKISDAAIINIGMMM